MLRQPRSLRGRARRFSRPNVGRGRRKTRGRNHESGANLANVERGLTKTRRRTGVPVHVGRTTQRESGDRGLSEADSRRKPGSPRSPPEAPPDARSSLNRDMLGSGRRSSCGASFASPAFRRSSSSSARSRSRARAAATIRSRRRRRSRKRSPTGARSNRSVRRAKRRRAPESAPVSARSSRVGAERRRSCAAR